MPHMTHRFATGKKPAVADDIVTRLREARIYNCYSCVEYGYDDECDCASRRLLHNDAADEIELMRMVIDQLGEALKTCRPWIDDFEQGDLALESWDKFRRG